MRRILWADDQIDVAKSFAGVLAATGAEIDFVADGETALQQMQLRHYDLVLTDLAMPPGQWGGLWLLGQLRASSNSPPVIVVSGEGAQGETIRALRLGAIDYVTKEQLSEELPQQILAALEARKSPSEVLQELIARGESDSVEFKSTLRYNITARVNDSRIELSVFKTIAGFLNAGGGTLLVGVKDCGEVVGIKSDGFATTDKFQLHFWNIFRDAIGSEFSEYIDTSLISLNGAVVFLIACVPSDRPVFVRWKEIGQAAYHDNFYVRLGPQTELLSTRKAVSYISDHFK